MVLLLQPVVVINLDNGVDHVCSTFYRYVCELGRGITQILLERYDTELNIGGQASSAKEIGTNNGLYYYQTESAIRAFRISDGKILWTNLDFGGPCLTSSVFDDAGTLYVGGWERTDLIVIDANGKTLAYIDLPDYASPRIELEETRAKLSFDYGPNESENVVYVDLRDYSVVLPEIEPSDNPAEPVSDIPVGVTGRQIEA